MKNFNSSFPSEADKFGKQVAGHLSEASQALPHDISERLRVARLQAMSQYKAVLASHTVSVSNGSAALHWHERFSPWQRLATLLPLLALIAGLAFIQLIENEDYANELAEIDMALLTDDLPPAAYADPGFLQFLKSSAKNPD